MEIEIFERMHQFDELASTWDAIHAKDENAHLFVSWRWLRMCFELSSDLWCVLAAKRSKDQEYVGFFPLTIKQITCCNIGRAYHICMGVKPFSEYTGFFCHPEYQATVLAFFADFLKRELHWEYCHLADVVDPRLDGFLDSFTNSEYTLIERSSLDCPRIRLASTWEEYLRNSLNRRSRRALRQTMRKLESIEGFHVSTASADNLAFHIETLLKMWQARHGKTSMDVVHHRRLLKAAFFSGNLWLKLAWSNNTPVVGLAIFEDPVDKVYYTFLTAYNPEFAKISPGLAMFGYAIREAITKGYKYFDLLRGAPEYKISRLGGESRSATSVVLRHRYAKFRSILNRLQNRSLFKHDLKRSATR